MPHDHHDHPHSLLPPDPALRVKALETILVRKGLVDPAAMEAILETYEKKVGPHLGRAASSHGPGRIAGLRGATFRECQCGDGRVGDSGAAGRACGGGGQPARELHNMVVCTLCSCYPWPLLGIPPAWYKSDAYRSRAVREPRRVLAEFGLDPARGAGSAGLGFDGRGPLSGGADAARRHAKAGARTVWPALSPATA